MLLAKEVRNSKKQAQVTTVRTVRRRVIVKRAPAKNYLVVTSLLILVSFLYLGLSFRGMMINRQLEQLHNRVIALQDENEYLNKVRDQYSSLDRLETIAHQELGLQRPTTNQLMLPD